MYINVLEANLFLSKVFEKISNSLLVLHFPSNYTCLADDSLLLSVANTRT